MKFHRATHLVVNFQNRNDAEVFHWKLIKRFKEFGLELAEEKMRLILFVRRARVKKAEYGEKPATFDFLGFTHVCGTDQGGNYTVVRIPSVKSCRKFLARTKEWLKGHIHWKKTDQKRQLKLMLLGFYEYFGLNHCNPKLAWIRKEVMLQWIRVLRR